MRLFVGFLRWSLPVLLVLSLVAQVAAQSQRSEEFAKLIKQAEDGDVSARYLLAWPTWGMVSLEMMRRVHVGFARQRSRDSLWLSSTLAWHTPTERVLPKDEAEAVRWYRKAAEQGYAQAQFNLGVVYANGRGVAKDEAEAVRWYRKAAEQGLAMAQYNLGVAYPKATVFRRMKSDAVGWDHKAAEQGLAQAEFQLGLAYELGEGVPKNQAEAYFWLNLGALPWMRKQEQSAMR